MGWRDLLSSIAKTVKDNINDELNKPKPSQPAQSSQPAHQTPYASAPMETVREKSPEEWVSYFREILHAEFSQYTIKENVLVTELVGFATEEAKLYPTRPQQAYKAEWGKPYTFVLYRGDRPAGVVMLGNGHSHDQNVKYLISRMYTKKLGIPYINFYTQMENKREYVIQRMRDFSM